MLDTAELKGRVDLLALIDAIRAHYTRLPGLPAAICRGLPVVWRPG